MKKVLLLIICSSLTFFSFILNLNALSNITLSIGTLVPYFNKNIYKYNIYVSNETDEINISAVLEETDNYMEGTGNIKLPLDENIIKLNLFEKDGNIKTYIIKVFKDSKKPVDVNNSLLKKLEIKNYNLNFDSNVFSYDINITNENELNINYEAFNNNANIKLTGNSNLKSGNNKIIITVTSEDKNTKSIYEINVNKTSEVFKEEKNKDKKETSSIFGNYILNSKDKIIIGVGIGLVIIIILSFLYYILFRFKSKKKK